MPPPPFHPCCLLRSFLSPTSLAIAHLNPNSLPHAPHVDSILQKWKAMGVSQPAVNRLSVATIPALWKKTSLLLQEGLSPQQIAKMIDVPDTYSFVSVPYEKLASCLNLLKSLDVTGQNAGNILTKCIIYKQALLANNLVMLQQKLERFHELGLDRALLRKILLAYPSVLARSSRKLGRLLEYLRGFGMDSEALVKVISRYPKVLEYSLEATIMPTVSYLESRGVSKEDTCRLFRVYPVCYTRSVDATRRRFECLERLGLQEHICKVHFHLSRCSSELIEARIEWLMSRGFSRVEVCRMVGIFPSVLTLSNQCLSKKLDYLVKVMKRDIKQIVACPLFLGLSLEKRIIPRFDVLTKLEENGTLHDQFSLSFIFAVPEKKFVKRFVETLQA